MGYLLRGTSVLALAAATLAIAGCGETQTSSVDVPAMPGPSASADRQAALLRGVLLCLTNGTEEDVTITRWTSTDGDQLPGKVLAPGGYGCGAATGDSGMYDPQVVGWVMLPGGIEAGIWATNSVPGWPSVGINRDPHTTDGPGASAYEFTESQSRALSWNYSVDGLTHLIPLDVVREPDTFVNKVFSATIRN